MYLINAGLVKKKDWGGYCVLHALLLYHINIPHLEYDNFRWYDNYLAFQNWF